jgi:hypothetical protein
MISFLKKQTFIHNQQNLLTSIAGKEFASLSSCYSSTHYLYTLMRVIKKTNFPARFRRAVWNYTAVNSDVPAQVFFCFSVPIASLRAAPAGGFR